MFVALCAIQDTWKRYSSPNNAPKRLNRNHDLIVRDRMPLNVLNIKFQSHSSLFSGFHRLLTASKGNDARDLALAPSPDGTLRPVGRHELHPRQLPT